MSIIWGQGTRVKKSGDIGDAIHRQRECEHCKGKTSTYERVEKFQLMVIKRDQRREPLIVRTRCTGHA